MLNNTIHSWNLVEFHPKSEKLKSFRPNKKHKTADKLLTERKVKEADENNEDFIGANVCSANDGNVQHWMTELEVITCYLKSSSWKLDNGNSFTTADMFS